MNKKQLFLIPVLMAACFFTIANSADPHAHLRGSLYIKDLKPEGNIQIITDKRLYNDKKCTITLSKDNYTNFKISYVQLSGMESSENEITEQDILQLKQGDPSLQGDPVRIVFQPPGEGQYKIFVENDQQQTGTLSFTVYKY